MKPTLPQGTRDFNAATVRKRNYIFNTIRNVFELYGFEPLETPAMENLETLTGKYGEEGDKLIFKILNNGLNDPKNSDKARFAFDNILQGKNDKNLTERALRYDLTIPFARYVAMNYNQLTFPYKRYQMQPVWRADRPQKGRYREFYQCDADVVGSNSLLNEVELANIYAAVFEKLGIEVVIKINSRKILAALAQLVALPDLVSEKTESPDVGSKMTDITIAIDKLDKIGIDKVKEELSQRGLNNIQISTIEQYLTINGSNNEKLKEAKALFLDQPSANDGLNEIAYLLNQHSKLSIDFTLARGLNYYTGIIFEVTAKNVQIGSIGGGGRYDDLTGLFGVPDIPGVGISFGVDRIYDVMEELKLFPEEIYTGTQALFLNLGEAEGSAAFALMQQLRAKNIRCEMYHENAKFDKQFKYAEKKGIGYTVKIGDKELADGTCVVKDIRSGEQHTISQSALVLFNFHR